MDTTCSCLIENAVPSQEKVKFSLEQAMKAQRGSGDTALLSL
jgi:hypothetical protein